MHVKKKKDNQDKLSRGGITILNVNINNPSRLHKILMNFLLQK